MKFKPILFNPEMSLATRKGLKNRTSRIINHDLSHDHSEYRGVKWKNEPPVYYNISDNQWACEYCGHGIDMGGHSYIKSKYQVGDILYVRETWGIGLQMANTVIYKADYIGKKAPLADGEKWKPNIHMFKSLARTFLKVTGVRIERIQDITIEEIIHEGVDSECRQCCLTPLCLDQKIKCDCYVEAFEMFEKLWNSTIEKKDFSKNSWAANPWVFVYEFELLEDDDLLLLGNGGEL